MTVTALWWAVIASGIYHGVNPGMGWPLAVSAGLMGKRRRDLFAALGPLALGHLIAMLAVLLPFAVLTSLVAWQSQIRIGAALIVISAGIWLLFNRRHPRFLARIKPTQLTLWSFAVALAHGAGLMLVPIYLGLCSAEQLDAGHSAASALITSNVSAAIWVSLVHSMAMIVSGGAIAVVIYEWLGLKFLSKTWFNLEVVWALSLVLVGALSLAGALLG